MAHSHGLPSFAYVRQLLAAYVILTGAFGFVALVLAVFVASPPSFLMFAAGLVSGLAYVVLLRRFQNRRLADLFPLWTRGHAI